MQGGEGRPGASLKAALAVVAELRCRQGQFCSSVRQSLRPLVYIGPPCQWPPASHLQPPQVRGGPPWRHPHVGSGSSAGAVCLLLLRRPCSALLAVAVQPDASHGRSHATMLAARPRVCHRRHGARGSGLGRGRPGAAGGGGQLQAHPQELREQSRTRALKAAVIFLVEACCHGCQTTLEKQSGNGRDGGVPG